MGNIFFSGSDTKLNQRLYLGKKGVGRTPPTTQTTVNYPRLLLDRVEVEVPIFIELISSGNKSENLMFLNSMTEKQSQYYLQVNKPT